MFFVCLYTTHLYKWGIVYDWVYQMGYLALWIQMPEKGQITYPYLRSFSFDTFLVAVPSLVHIPPTSLCQ